ncbi:CheR family methyltransferase [Desulfosporosinus hippei]|uniref:protein-glutamate O-methyltransferase n=1 Tax=Desulfosporosinus hippei DSM 8344 TaxID=1121419 RepID=A0A1G7WCF2_9FIRM|nr:CheR family methyltransferase [Desulfosporosinus hippei]SDG69499.1 chemotaxis protein methyltransferase CheR [Desulfosporosinus hippei DSM 8344]
MTLTPELYQRFIDLVYKKTGIMFEENKRYFVERRLTDRVEQLEIDSFRDYFFMLKYSNDESELQEITNRLTINETYFFRDFPQLQGFAESVLPQMIKSKEAAGQRTLKIWSAGCATGEEPYTLAIILMEMIPDFEKWKIQILGTDINTRVLDLARKGLYNSRSIKDVPLDYLERYFTKRGSMYSMNLNVKGMVDYRILNLSDQSKFRDHQSFDFIFCRNVLIYFDTASRFKVLDSFYNSLRSGGIIYLGHSESVARITEAFKMKRIQDNIYYYKP